MLPTSLKIVLGGSKQLDELGLWADQFFAGVPREPMRRVRQSARRVEFRHGDTIWNEQEPCDSVYVVCAGEVQVFRHAELTLGLPPGVLGWLLPGEVFGEMSVPFQRRGNVTYTAYIHSPGRDVPSNSPPIELLRIDAGLFNQLRWECTEFDERVLELVAARQSATKTGFRKTSQ